MFRRLSLLVFLTCGVMARPAHAQAPGTEPQPEQLPVPQAVTVERVVIVPWSPPLGTREVWSNFSLDYAGRLRPRVVLAPYGTSYYRYNGQPYPFLPTRNFSYRPGASR